MKADVMANKHESKWNIEDMTDPEIYDGIRYLEPKSTSVTEENDDSGLASVSLLVLLLGCLGIMLLYWR